MVLDMLYILRKKDKENKELLDSFSKAGPERLHNSKVAKEGYDCPGLGLVIITGFHSDKISLQQCVGRGVRLNPVNMQKFLSYV